MNDARRNFLVTGVSRGLGRALVSELLSRGHSVLGVGRRASAEHLAHPNFTFTELDLSDAKAIGAFLLGFTPDTVPAHVLLNAALIENDSERGEFSAERFRAIFDVNFNANIQILSGLLPLSRISGKGVYCAISSLSAVRPIGTGGLAYAASKAALTSVFESLRLTDESSGLSFLTVLPGALAEKGKWPWKESYDSAAKRIVRALERRTRFIFIPFWKFLFLQLSKPFPIRWVNQLKS